MHAPPGLAYRAPRAARLLPRWDPDSLAMLQACRSTFFPHWKSSPILISGPLLCSLLCLDLSFFHPSGLRSNVTSSETLSDHLCHKPILTGMPSACPALFNALSCNIIVIK